ncbi:hypothetical protein ASF59_00050 [Methylobacterium sp. Leaf121]|nr:hypothetical protein ASF59_00050 [Methylobacterium sp. Leaf121]
MSFHCRVVRIGVESNLKIKAIPCGSQVAVKVIEIIEESLFLPLGFSVQKGTKLVSKSGFVLGMLSAHHLRQLKVYSIKKFYHEVKVLRTKHRQISLSSGLAHDSEDPKFNISQFCTFES